MIGERHRRLGATGVPEAAIIGLQPPVDLYIRRLENGTVACPMPVREG